MLSLVIACLMPLADHNPQRSPLAYATTEPNLPELRYVYERCSPYYGPWNRLADNDAVRYMLWEGQSADGRKWDYNMPNGKEAEPWDGASDARIPLADSIINRNTAILSEAFHRSLLRLDGTEPDDLQMAGQARRALEWMKTSKMLGELRREIELLAQFGMGYGAALMHIDWEREIAFKLYEVTLEELAQLPTASGQPFAELIIDETREDEAVELLTVLYQTYAESKKPSNYTYAIKPISDRRARMAVKQLRNEGRSQVPVPYVCKNKPFVKALKLWEDVFVPPEITDVQSARVIFVRTWYTEAELVATATAEGWDEDFTEKVKQFKGHYSTWRWKGSNTLTGIPTFEYMRDQDGELIEILTAYCKQVDDDGIAGWYRTIFHAELCSKQNGLFGLHGLLPHWHGKAPFVEWRFETNTRQMLLSRGIPYVTATWQRAIKVQVDAVTDRTSYNVLPSIIVPQNANLRFGPAYQIYVPRPDQAPRFMDAPGGNGVQESFALVQHIQKQCDDYYGRRRGDEPPEESIAIMQRLVRSFLTSCSEMMQQVMQLMLQYLPPEEIERITSTPFQKLDPVDVAEMFDFMLGFDIQEINPDFMSKKLDALTAKVLPGDVAGVIDRAKLTKMMIAAIDPMWLGALGQDKVGAEQAKFQQVQNDFISMFQGNPPRLIQDDPTAQMELQFAQQIFASNPVYLKAVQQPSMPEHEIFKAHVEEWFKNRNFNVDQMINNPQIGKLGVNPNAKRAA